MSVPQCCGQLWGVPASYMRSALHTEPWVPRAYQACGEAGREAGGADGVNEKCRQDLTINLQDLGNREVIPSGINLEKGKQITSSGF